MQHVHFVAIGGAGMSGIAQVLLAQGYRVSGSDAKPSRWTARLEEMGAKVYLGHRGEHVNGADLVVVSSAIDTSNAEVRAARERGIPVVHRGDMLARLMAEKKGIGVAGAHGKTTTTAMIAMVLEACGYHPTVLVGGEVIDLPGNAKLGRGEYLVAETDESDGSFLKLRPSIAVVTNIDDDHLDHYGTLDSIRQAFVKYLDGVAPDGRCVLCADDEHLRELAVGQPWPVTWYGLHHPAHWQANDVCQEGWRLSFSVSRDLRRVGSVELGVIGEHNVANALAALAVAEIVGIPFSRAAQGLARFRGVSRRMERVGQARGVWVVDDFAHHPTEIRASLETVAKATPGRVICIFQPHRYSRTRQLAGDFGKAFRSAHHIFLAGIYAGPGELPEPGVDAGLIARALEANGKAVTHLEDRDALVEASCRLVRPGDVIMTVGAGDVGLWGEKLLQCLAR